MTWGLSLLHLALASSICVGILYIEIPGKHPDTTASRAGRRNISSRACVLSHFSCIQLCATLWTVCSPPGFSVHGISQARILEWVSVSFSRGSFQPRDQTFVTKSLFLYWGSLPKPLTPLNVITWPSMTQALVTDVMNGLKYSAVTPGLRADSPSPKIG